MYRSKRLLNAAKGRDCTLAIPTVCNRNPETVVAAHSNWSEHGKGMGIKAHDCFIAFACSSCHAEIDQGFRLTKDEKMWVWRKGFEATMLQLFLDGTVGVK